MQTGRQAGRQEGRKEVLFKRAYLPSGKGVFLPCKEFLLRKCHFTVRVPELDIEFNTVQNKTTQTTQLASSNHESKQNLLNPTGPYAALYAT